MVGQCSFSSGGSKVFCINYNNVPWWNKSDTRSQFSIAFHEINSLVRPTWWNYDAWHLLILEQAKWRSATQINWNSIKNQPFVPAERESQCSNGVVMMPLLVSDIYFRWFFLLHNTTILFFPNWQFGKQLENDAREPTGWF